MWLIKNKGERRGPVMLPDKVVIGCYEYQVVETDGPLVLNGNECSGLMVLRCENCGKEKVMLD